MGRNSVKKVREKLLMSKAELAREAGVSTQTIDRSRILNLIVGGLTL